MRLRFTVTWAKRCLSFGILDAKALPILGFSSLPHVLLSCYHLEFFFFCFHYIIQLAQLIFSFQTFSHTSDQFWPQSSSTNALNNSGCRSLWGPKDLHVSIVASRRLQIIISLPHTGTEQNETQKNKVDGKSNITVFADKMKLGSLDQEPNRPIHWTSNLGT